MVERRAERMHPFQSQRPIAWLETDDPAEGRRADDGAEGLRAERQWHDAGGDRGGRAARRAARRVSEVPRIARRSGLPPGELGGDGLADEMRPERAEPTDHPR